MGSLVSHRPQGRVFQGENLLPEFPACGLALRNDCLNAKPQAEPYRELISQITAVISLDRNRALPAFHLPHLNTVFCE
jgi:hypothetical protein